MLPEREPILTANLKVEAACVSGYEADPAPNLIIVSVTDGDGNPVPGLEAKDFTVVNYSMTDGHARLVQLRTVLELRQELLFANIVTHIDGVYKIEPEREPEITGQVGQTVYVVKINKIVRSFIHPTRYTGQTVVAVVMQARPF